MFKAVDSQMNLPKSEEEILKFWDENKTFERSLENRKDSPLYSFYDGPPFATGTPHYGHILQSISKDVVPRYWTMKGFQVERRWGWDCHGLPIENLVEKELGITRKKQIEEMGVDKFCDLCRSKILGFVPEWKKVIRRLGRWVDMENPYMTMDQSYMESIWWVFKQLWDNGLVYEDYRSMHICPRCETTLSQSEVTEGYRLTKDLSATAKFELLYEADEITEDGPVFILAWTTTPWTLIGNVALAVGNEIDYVKVKVEGESLILAKDRLKDVLKDKKYEIITQFKGKDLVGIHYRPLFNYYFNQAELKDGENGWEIYPADFVTTEDGTGVVHIAPAFGEDDMNLGRKYSLPFVQHVGMDGLIKPEAEEFAGMSVKPADDHTKTDVEIIKYLAAKNLLFDKEKYEHSYPHCWRCETPLINYATSSWFVNITKIKPKMLELAKAIEWSPKHIKNGRFGKWLEGAKDWAISRQRFWASCIPIWKCSQCGEHVVIGSISELEQLSGIKITDLHKDKIDPVTFACKKCGGTMKRVPDVLDTWFDSGSMPYAELHYPFENKDKFDKKFPANFIGEMVEQSQKWFYYLHSISAAIKDNIAFKNVVASGVVLAEDGKKMSKRLQNYPDPVLMLDKYGADVMRFYMLSSSLLQAENLNFKESEMGDISRGMFRMLWNSYSFFVLYANIDSWKPNTEKTDASDNVLDRWIISELNALIKEVNAGMEKYNLTKTTRLFPAFIDNLSNWYIRRSRKRFWKSENDSDKDAAYHTLYEVLVTLAKLMAPFTPFLAEEIYKNLTDRESVHLEEFPKSDNAKIDKELNARMLEARKIVEEGLSARAAAKIKVRQPLASLTYFGKKLEKELEEIVAEEVNVKSVNYSEEKSDVNLKLDLEITPELKMEGTAREIIRNIQSLRKNSGFDVENRIEVFYQTDSSYLSSVLEKLNDVIAKEVLANDIRNQKAEVEGEESYNIDGEPVWIGIKRV